MKSTNQMRAALSIGVLLGALGCATAMPTPALLRARDAYYKAHDGPAKDLNPADLHDAEMLLSAAETAAKDDANSPVAINRAYLAERRAELADAQGRTSLAARQKAQAEQELVALKDAALTRARGQLSEASQNQQRSDAALSQAQSDLGASQRARAESKGQLAESDGQLAESKGQLAEANEGKEQAEQKLAAKSTELAAEHEARLASDQRAQESVDALAKIAATTKEMRGVVITLTGSVAFRSGKSELLPAAQQKLDQVAEALKTDERTILVEGHTDASGAEPFNQALSERRASAVLEYLVSRHVARERIRAVGLGSTREVDEDATAEGRANNRRVEIVLEPLPLN